MPTYDELPYPSHAFPATAPDRLATIGAVFGVPTAPPERCAVLELGCGSGGNLLPLAAASSEGRFVGVDRSAVQIGLGEARRRALGLEHAELLVADLATWRPEPGRFDYVICHGVLSWVPAPVRAAILDIVREALAPGGVACVSYNVSPGWAVRGALRDACEVLARPGDGPAGRAAHTRHVLELLASATASESTPWGRVFAEAHHRSSGWSDAYLAHEFLDGEQQAFSISAFASLARAAGLRYLGDSHLPRMFEHLLEPSLAVALAPLASDVVAVEQYLDAARGRMFRHSLLVRADEAVNRDVRALPPDGFFVAVPPDARIDAEAEVLAWFEDARSRWPKAALVPDAVRMQWALQGALLGFAELRRREGPPAARAGERPTAWSYARLEAHVSPVVTSLLHDSHALDPLELFVLALADGGRTRAALAAEVAAVARRSSELGPERVEADVEATLDRLSALGLMVA